MIQRIQTIYIGLTLVALIIVSLGQDIFTTTIHQKNQFELITHGNVYGIQKDVHVEGDILPKNVTLLQKATEQKKWKGKENLTEIPTFYFPFYSISILLSMLAVVVLLGYKNLKRQIRLGRLLFFCNLLVFIASIVLYYVMNSNTPNIDGAETTLYLGIGFYCIAAALAFSFLAIIRIKRDLKLISSIDRIR